ncbi:MAG: carboxypeptidase regulatory-like domain-containing protein, partial [Bacteroidota bacterium]
SFEIVINDVDSVVFADGVTMGRTDGRVESSFPVNINTDFSANTSIKGSLTFTPTVDINLDLSGFSVDEISMNATVAVQSNLEFSSTATGSIGAEKTIATFFLKPIPIKFLVFIPRLTIKINANGQISAGLEAKASRTLTASGGIRYDDSGWNAERNLVDDYIIQPLIPTGNALAEIAVKPQIDFLLFGVAGPSFTPELWLQYNIDIQRDPCWLVEAGLRGSVGVTLGGLFSSFSANTSPITLQSGIVKESEVSCREPGTIEGRVIDALNNTGIAGVVITVKQNDNAVATGETLSDGLYQIDIPEGSDYTLEFAKEGFITATRENVEVVANSITFIETTLQIDEQFSGLGNIAGQIINALTGFGETDVTLDVRQGLGNVSGQILGTTASGQSGFYEFTDLEAGNYTIEASKDGFLSSFFSVIVIGAQTTGRQNGTITPENSDVFRIVLTWGQTPSDLDSHLTGDTETGGRFHLYFSNQRPSGSNAVLDVDDVTSFGPETVTISELNSGTYRYSVHDYSNRSSSASTALAGSQAKVTVFSSAGTREFFVPTGGGTLWTVFEIQNGAIVPINQMSSVSDPSAVTKGERENDHTLIIEATEKAKKKVN